MKYRQGAYGRVFMLKFEDRDDLLEEIRRLARTENIKVATITLLGGLRSAGMVTGPKAPVVPPEPIWHGFSDGREVIGFGSLLWSGDEPVIHLHGAVGRGDEARVGCIRKDSAVYLIVEAVVSEIVGVDARKVRDPASGLTLLEL